MAAKKWRVINNNKIQTWSSYVWLWDSKLGVAVNAPRAGRPWTKINPDFTHWMPAESGSAPPGGSPEDSTYVANEQLAEFFSAAVFGDVMRGHLPSVAIVDDEDEDDDDFYDDDDDCWYDEGEADDE